MSIREQNLIIDRIHALTDALTSVTSSDVRADRLESLKAEVAFHNEMAMKLSCDTLATALDTTYHTRYALTVKETSENNFRIVFKVDNFCLNSIVPFIDGKKAESLYEMYFTYYIENRKGTPSVSKSQLKKASLDFIDRIDGKKAIFTSADVNDVLAVFDRDGKIYNWKKDVTMSAFLEKFARIMMRNYHNSDIVFATYDMTKSVKTVTVYDAEVKAVTAQDNTIVSVA